MIAEARREEIKALLMDSGAVTVGELQIRYGISPMTARRDLEALERRGSARRTHGGAVLPASHAPVLRGTAVEEADQRLADSAFALLRAEESVFLDSSPAAYRLALRIATGGVGMRVLTNSGPVMLALLACEDARVQLYALGGQERRRTGSFVGPATVRTVYDHFADRCFLGVAGIARGRVLTDDDDLEAAVKHAMIEQSRESVLMLDGSKLTQHGGYVIAPLKRITLVIADGLSEQDAQALSAEGVEVRTA